MTGSGTEESPYIISSLADLQAMENDLSAYYELANDINALATSGWNDGLGFDPIGKSVEDHIELAFSGSFDGKEHIITNLFINRPAESPVGLFGATFDGFIEIQNVGLVNVNMTGQTRVGALVGVAYNGTVQECFSTGTIVSIGYYAGGLVGINQAGGIGDCYSRCSVEGVNRVGGLVGMNWASGIVKSYSTGLVVGVADIGGLNGVTPTGGHGVSSSFWDTQTSNQETSVGGTPKTTAQMKTESTFTIAAWDFVDVWSIDEAINDGYPYLAPLAPVPEPTLAYSQGQIIG